MGKNFFYLRYNVEEKLYLKTTNEYDCSYRGKVCVMNRSLNVVNENQYDVKVYDIGSIIYVT